MTAPALASVPLTYYLREEEELTRKVLADLADAQADATRRLTKLANRSGVGAQVERSQLTLIRQQLIATQRELWAQLGKDIRAAGQGAADAAAAAVDTLDSALFASAGQHLPEELARAHQAYAREVVETYFSRMQNGISLSDQVYKSRALSQGWVDRAVNRTILQGGSWRDLMQRVLPMIDPNTPGGVSYAAKRLARTELNNAFHTTQVRLGQGNPWVEGQKWNLSRKHPKADNCDAYANEVHTKGGEPGVYEANNVPAKPHPQCYCFITAVTVSEDEFFNRLMAGDYEDATEPFSLPPPAAALRRAG